MVQGTMIKELCVKLILYFEQNFFYFTFPIFYNTFLQLKQIFGDLDNEITKMILALLKQKFATQNLFNLNLEVVFSQNVFDFYALQL